MRLSSVPWHNAPVVAPGAQPPNVFSLFLFFAGIALCMWRAPRGDRMHLALTGIAGVLWCMLPVFDPSIRTPGYGVIVGILTIIAMSQPLRRQS